MKIFLIDNNIDGLLSALYLSFTEKIYPDDVVDKKSFQPRLDALAMDIISDNNKVNRVKTALFKYGGDDIIAHLKVCLSSCAVGSIYIAFKYAYLTLKKRRDVSEELSEKVVSDFSFTVQKVLHERHIVSGFLRFKESAGGVMYTQYAPDNDITSILAPHFLIRLGSLPFIIHDVRRGKIAISDGRAIKIDYTDLPVNFSPAETETAINALWRRYYKEINIKERQNLRQQTSYFPHRYRKYCFETWE